MPEIEFGRPIPAPHRDYHEVGGVDAIRAVTGARRLVLPMQNASGAAQVIGTIVSYRTSVTADLSFTVASANQTNDGRTLGVLLSNVPATGQAQVAVYGYVEKVRCASNVTRYQRLYQSSTAGVAAGATSRRGTFGVALSSYNAITGTCSALLINSEADGLLDARDFGADPLGSSDSDSAINTALVAAASAGFRGVFLVAGTYLLASWLILQTDVQLVGAGWHSTILKIKDATNINAIDTSENVYRAVVKNLQIDCNKANNTSNGAAVKGWYDHSQFEWVWVKNCEREAFYFCPGDGYAEAAPGVSAIAITAISVANPTHITTSTAHGLITGQKVVLAGSDSTPTVDGTRTVTRISDTEFTVAVNVTVAGTTGTSTESYPSQNAFDNRILNIEVEDSDITFRYTSQFTDQWIGPGVNVAASTANVYCSSQGSPILFRSCWFNGNPVNNIYYPASGSGITFADCVIENSQQHNILITEPSYVAGDHEAFINITGGYIKNGNSSAGAYDAVHIEGYDATHRLVNVQINGVTFANDVNTPRYGVYLKHVKDVKLGPNGADAFGTAYWKLEGTANANIQILEPYPEEQRVTADVTVNNTVTETAIFSQSIAGGNLVTDKRLRLTLEGTYTNNAGAGRALQVKVKYGATTLIDETSNGNITQSAAARAFKWVVELSNRGATNSQFASLFGQIAAAGTGFYDANASEGWVLMSVGTAAEDSTADKTFAVTVTHSNNDTNLTLQAAILEVV